jgi:cytochrome c5
VLSSSGAPLTGDTAAWQPRMQQGMDTLLQHVVEGFGGMPPLGLCFECDEQQFEALIEFMAN